jgi:hypothetical protein
MGLTPLVAAVLMLAGSLLTAGSVAAAGTTCARPAPSTTQPNVFVSRAIRENAHCGYTQAELQRGFSDLVRWFRTGHRAVGDDILNPTVVAQPSFGCTFTDGPHPEFSPACPGKSPRG